MSMMATPLSRGVASLSLTRDTIIIREELAKHKKAAQSQRPWADKNANE
jgi:hypothetical protein